MRALTFLILLFLVYSCDNPDLPRTIAKRPPVKDLDTPCSEKMMTEVDYFEGKDTSIQATWNLKPGFQIWLDTNQKAWNIVTEREFFYRQEKSIDYEIQNENYFLKQHPEKPKPDRQKIKIKNLRAANRLHWLANRGQQIVWVANNSKDTIFIPTQDGYFSGRLEAKDKTGRWKQIEHGRCEFIGGLCGDLISEMKLAPGRAIPIILRKDFSGNFKTRLRYKLWKDRKYYYSNSIIASINYCLFWVEKKKHEFVIDTSSIEPTP